MNCAIRLSQSLAPLPGRLEWRFFQFLRDPLGPEYAKNKVNLAQLRKRNQSPTRYFFKEPVDPPEKASSSQCRTAAILSL